MNDNRSTLPPNTILVDGFRIERFIGAGGFGITYLGEDLHLGTTVAIKEYYPDEFGDRDASLSVRPKTDRHRQTFEWGRTSFLQEARMLARFRHPSIVRITRVFEANATAYMVMEFEEGRSLESWLKSLERPPTQAELDRIVAPLLDALELMHADSFLHRDIAPDNIIIRPDGTPVLLDFGAARRAMAEQSRVLTGIIKAGYSPQEQYASDGRLQGPWSDIYALGATLYRAVTGKPPEEATLRAGDDQTPAAEKAVQGEYRPAFLAAIDTCLNVDRKRRPQSVAELRAVLAGKVTKAKAKTTRLESALSYMGEDRNALWLPWWLGWLDVPKGKRLRSALAVLLAFVLVIGAYAVVEHMDRLAEERAAKQRSDEALARQREAEAKRLEEERLLKERQANEERMRSEAEAEEKRKTEAERKRLREYMQSLEERAREQMRVEEQKETRQREQPTATVPVPPAPFIPRDRTNWDHNGSKVYLVVEGNRRRFYYAEPRLGMQRAGAKKDDLLFEGTSDGKSYVGTAFIFNLQCRPTAYRVRGPILDGGRRVVMRGSAPRINNDCQVSGHTPDTLTFTLSPEH